MVAGRALAATDVGDIRYMLAEENRPFVVERSSDALSAAISILLDDPSRAAAIGAANARRAREMFDQQIMFAHYRRLFDGSAPSPSISFMRWRVDGLKLGVMHRSRVISGMGSSGETGQRDRGLGGRD